MGHIRFLHKISVILKIVLNVSDHKVLLIPYARKLLKYWQWWQSVDVIVFSNYNFYCSWFLWRSYNIDEFDMSRIESLTFRDPYKLRVSPAAILFLCMCYVCVLTYAPSIMLWLFQSVRFKNSVCHACVGMDVL